MVPVQEALPGVPAVKDMALTPANESPALTLLHRFAADPNFDVSKMQAMMDMRERELDRIAAQEFNAAFAKMQPRIPIIGEKSKTDKTTYAPREDIVEVITPILAEFGFALSFKTTFPDGKILITGKLKHVGGHCEESEFLTDADQTGSKNAIQARGSAVEYGRRYTTCDLLNIATRKADDDGKRATAEPAPEGYDNWRDDIDAMVTGGATWAELETAWKKSPDDFRRYITKTEKHTVEGWKKKAKAVANG